MDLVSSQQKPAERRKETICRKHNDQRPTLETVQPALMCRLLIDRLTAPPAALTHWEVGTWHAGTQNYYTGITSLLTVQLM